MKNMRIVLQNTRLILLSVNLKKKKNKCSITIEQQLYS